ncbi:hypothetical protein FO519_007704 [Halicephalobus sp. NKZ332]|nr:hypothetical protein FO519_007704 [Halicephalobus sp. NKZ332]
MAVGSSYLCEYEVFHVVSTEESFTIIHPNEVKSFNPDGHRDEHAFLTIWTENDDGSWSVYCENHPILKSSEIWVGSRHSKDLNLVVQKPCYNNFKITKKKGEVTVYNYSSKKIWIRIDADDIQKTKTNVSQSLEASNKELSVFSSSDYLANDRVYYRTQQERGYTQINPGKSINFYPKISRNRIYLSINYETESGRLEKHCINHPIVHLTDGSGKMFLITTRDSGKGITFDITRGLFDLIESFHDICTTDNRFVL